jgi:3',5'-cyclic AMP phosphodiesterase CpdA
VQTAKLDTTRRADATGKGNERAVVDASFTLAQLSDPHLTSLEGVSCGALLNKRVLGYLSWRRRRRHEHRSEVLDLLLEDLAGIKPDHVAVTGDLTHLGLPKEFRQARDWLKTLGSPDRVTVIPGNHDTYVATAWEDTFAQWVPYMASDDTDNDCATASSLFPSLRVRGDIALIGISTAVPTAPFMATGKMGQAQLGRLEKILGDAREKGLFRVIMIHHPPLAGTVKWRKRLVDGHRLESLLRTSGAELVLHGHAHKTTVTQLQGERQSIPVIGVPSSSAIGERPGYRARYHIYRISRRAGNWKMQIEVRGYDAERRQFTAEDGLSL